MKLYEKNVLQAESALKLGNNLLRKDIKLLDAVMMLKNREQSIISQLQLRSLFSQ